MKSHATIRKDSARRTATIRDESESDDGRVSGEQGCLSMDRTEENGKWVSMSCQTSY